MIAALETRRWHRAPQQVADASPYRDAIRGSGAAAASERNNESPSCQLARRLPWSPERGPGSALGSRNSTKAHRRRSGREARAPLRGPAGRRSRTEGSKIAQPRRKPVARPVKSSDDREPVQLVPQPIASGVRRGIALEDVTPQVHELARSTRALGVITVHEQRKSLSVCAVLSSSKARPAGSFARAPRQRDDSIKPHLAASAGSASLNSARFRSVRTRASRQPLQLEPSLGFPSGAGCHRSARAPALIRRARARSPEHHGRSLVDTRARAARLRIRAQRFAVELDLRATQRFEQ